jgi:hypothetical protein
MGDAGFDASFVVFGGEAGLEALVEAGRHRLEAHLSPAVDVAANMLVDAEDLLDDDDAPLARAAGGGVVGREGEAVLGRRLDLDGVAHARFPL